MAAPACAAVEGRRETLWVTSLEGIWNAVPKIQFLELGKKTQGEKLVRQFLNKRAISSCESRLYVSKCQVANGL